MGAGCGMSVSEAGTGGNNFTKVDGKNDAIRRKTATIRAVSITHAIARSQNPANAGRAGSEGEILNRWNRFREDERFAEHTQDRFARHSREFRIAGSSWLRQESPLRIFHKLRSHSSRKVPKKPNSRGFALQRLGTPISRLADAIQENGVPRRSRRNQTSAYVSRQAIRGRPRPDRCFVEGFHPRVSAGRRRTYPSPQRAARERPIHEKAGRRCARQFRRRNPTRACLHGRQSRDWSSERSRQIASQSNGESERRSIISTETPSRSSCAAATSAR